MYGTPRERHGRYERSEGFFSDDAHTQRRRRKLSPNVERAMRDGLQRGWRPQSRVDVLGEGRVAGEPRTAPAETRRSLFRSGDAWDGMYGGYRSDSIPPDAPSTTSHVAPLHASLFSPIRSSPGRHAVTLARQKDVLTPPSAYRGRGGSGFGMGWGDGDEDDEEFPMDDALDALPRRPSVSTAVRGIGTESSLGVSPSLPTASPPKDMSVSELRVLKQENSVLAEAMGRGLVQSDSVDEWRKYRKQLQTMVGELKIKLGKTEGKQEEGEGGEEEGEGEEEEDREASPVARPSWLDLLTSATRKGPLPKSPCLRRALHTFRGDPNGGEINVVRGQTVVVLKATHPEWIFVRVRRREGWCPRWVCEDPGAEALEEELTLEEAMKRAAGGSGGGGGGEGGGGGGGRAIEKLGLDADATIGGNAVPASPAELAARELIRLAADAAAAALRDTDVDPSEAPPSGSAPPIPIVGGDAEGETRKAQIDGFVLDLSKDPKTGGWIAAPQATVRADGTEAFWDGSEFWYKKSSSKASHIDGEGEEGGGGGGGGGGGEGEGGEGGEGEGGGGGGEGGKGEGGEGGWVDEEGRSWEERLAEGHAAPAEATVLIDGEKGEGDGERVEGDSYTTPKDETVDGSEWILATEGKRFDSAEPTQRGLVQDLENKSGRRVKAVFLSGEELWRAMRGRLAGVGFAIRTARIGKRRRLAALAFTSGLAMTLLRKRREARIATRAFTLGLTRWSRRNRIVRGIVTSVFGLGLAGVSIQWKKAEELRKARAEEKKRKKEMKKVPSRRYVRLDALKSSKISKDSMWADAAMSVGGSGGGGAGDDLQVDAKGFMQRKDSILDSFNIKPAGRRGGAGGTPKGPEKPKVQSTFDSKDLKNIELIVNKIIRKISTTDLRDSIARLDADGIGGAEVAEQLLRATPCFESDRVRKVKGLRLGEGESLAIPDQFVLDVVDQVPQIQDRLRVMTFQIAFPEQETRARGLLETFLACCDELLTSARYRMLLTQVVLPLNNLLSGDSLSGFKVRDLPKLKATKNSQGKTFLDVVVEFCLGDGQCPLLVDLDGDFETLRRTPVALLELSDIKRSVNDLRAEMTPLRRLANASKAAPEGPMVQEMLQDAEGRIKDVEELLSDAEQSCGKLYEYISQDKSETTPKEVFANIQVFLKDVKKAVDVGMRRRRAQEREAAKQARLKEQASHSASAPVLVDKKAASPPSAKAVGAPPPPPRRATRATIEPLPPTESEREGGLALDFHIDDKAVADQDRAIHNATSRSIDGKGVFDGIVEGGGDDDTISSTSESTVMSDEEGEGGDEGVAALPTIPSSGRRTTSPASYTSPHTIHGFPTTTPSPRHLDRELALSGPPPSRRSVSAASPDSFHSAPMRRSLSHLHGGGSPPATRPRRASRLERFAVRMQQRRGDKDGASTLGLGAVDLRSLSKEDQRRMSVSLGNSMKQFLAVRVRSTSVDPLLHRAPSGLRSASSQPTTGTAHEAPPLLARAISGPEFLSAPPPPPRRKSKSIPAAPTSSEE